MILSAKLQMPPENGWPSPRGLSLFVIKSMRAAWELARARQQFGKLTVRQILQRKDAFTDFVYTPSAAQTHIVAWVSYVVPRIARVMPWRSDCLVQALAAQNWLATHQINSEIVIGVEKPGAMDFESHAWLKCGEVIVTGGKIDKYTVIL